MPDQRGCRVTSDAVVSDREGNPRAAETNRGYREGYEAGMRAQREAKRKRGKLHSVG